MMAFDWFVIPTESPTTKELLENCQTWE